jgi:hypothetical protein
MGEKAAEPPARGDGEESNKCRKRGEGAAGPEDRATAERLAAVEVAASLRTAFVDGAEPGERIEGDARAVAALLHAAHAAVLDHELLRHVVPERRELDD